MEDFSEHVAEGVVLMVGRRTGFLFAGMNEIKSDS